MNSASRAVDRRRRRDAIWGAVIAAGLLARAMRQKRPRPISLRERLAALPVRDAPVDAAVTISWDDHQIPFIEADSDGDLAVALGVVHAHLRLGQIELMRRLASGRLSELVGPAGLEIDHTMRAIGFGRAVPEIVAALPAATRTWLEGFVRGINHVVARAPALPHELALLRCRPEPWTLGDVVLLARFMAADVNWLLWARLLRARGRLGEGSWAALWPQLLDEVPGEAGHPDGALAASPTGSNAMAVAGSRTAHGAAVIASDPHLPIALPNLWLIAGFRSPSTHAVGLMLPGLPIVALGRNPWIAWGGTSLHAASSDLFDVSGLGDDAITERIEIVKVRGGRPRRLRLRETRLGPIVSDVRLFRGSRPLALRWVGHRPSDELSAMLAVARARDWDGFRAALAGFAVPGENMIFAGADGRVGRLFAAHVPRRHAGAPEDFVAQPAAAACWDTLGCGGDLPAVFDPPEGYVASANERPDGCDFPLGFFFSPPDRVRRIRAALDGEHRLGAEDLRRLQRDVVEPSALAMRDYLLHRLRNPAPGQPGRAVVQAIAEWDGRHAADSAGALAFELVIAHLTPAICGRGSLGLYSSTWMARNLIARALRAAPQDKLQAAWQAALKRAARGLARWKVWGAAHRLRLAHMLAALPVVGRRYVFADLPADGANDTLYKTAHGLATGRHAVRYGSMARHVSNLADPDANSFVLLGGQDGWIGSDTFVDQAALWQRGEACIVPLRPETVRRTFPHRTVLTPADPATAS